MPRIGDNAPNTEQLRVTAFFDGVWGDGRPSIADMFGMDVEESSQRNSGRDFSETGSLGVGKIHLTLAAGRVDWIWTLSPDTGMAGNLGDLSEALDTMLAKACEKLANSGMSFTRLAIGTTLVVGVSDRAEGYTHLQKVFPSLDLDPSRAEDFSFQINYPVQESVADVSYRLNRLAKWGVRVGNVQLQITPQGLSFISGSTPTFGLLVELDLNTGPDTKLAFADGQIPPVFERMREEMLKMTDEPRYERK